MAMDTPERRKAQSIPRVAPDDSDSAIALLLGSRLLMAFPVFENKSSTGMVVMPGSSRRAHGTAELCALAMVSSLPGRAIEAQRSRKDRERTRPRRAIPAVAERLLARKGYRATTVVEIPGEAMPAVLFVSSVGEPPIQSCRVGPGAGRGGRRAPGSPWRICAVSQAMCWHG